MTAMNRQLHDKQIQEVIDWTKKEGTFVSFRTIDNIDILKYRDPDYNRHRKYILKQHQRHKDKDWYERSKKGKYRYSINHFSVIHRTDLDYKTNKIHWVYEVYPVHGNNYQLFNSLKEVIEFIKAYQAGNVHFTHYCECGAVWSDQN